MTFDEALVGTRVRQRDWLLQPRGYRDGVIIERGEPAKGTRHGWVIVRFDPQNYNPHPNDLACSSAQLTPVQP